MVGVLMGAGVAALVGGLLALMISIPIRDFSFGSTLMIVGAIGASCGLIVIALSNILREIRKMSAPPLVLPATTARPEFPPRVATEPAVATMAFPPPRRPAPERSPLPTHLDAGSSPAAAESRTTTPSAPPSKRNRLFQREAEAEQTQPQPDRTASKEEDERATGEEPWPSRPAEGLWKRRRREGVPPPREPMLDLGAKDAAAEQPRVTVLKSGEVDGMAYTLYSDGSIEAQLAEGMVRFASIEALRAHLDQRPAST